METTAPLLQLLKAGLFAACLAAMLGPTSPAQGQRMPRKDKQSDWYFVAQQDGVVVHAKDHPGRALPTLRGVGIVEASFFEISAVLADTARQPEWLTNCLKAETLKADHPFDLVLYTVSDAPWPVSDRDVVFRVTTQYEPHKGRMLIRFAHTTHPDRPVQPGVVRIPVLSGYYLLQALGPRRTRVTFQVDTDPGGLIPEWLIKLVTREYPLDTIRKMRTQLDKTRGQYADEVGRWQKRFGDYRVPPAK